MPEIDLDFIKHKLTILLDAGSVKQRGRRSTPENVDAVIEEVDKLKEERTIT